MRSVAQLKGSNPNVTKLRLISAIREGVLGCVIVDRITLCAHHCLLIIGSESGENINQKCLQIFLLGRARNGDPSLPN